MPKLICRDCGDLVDGEGKLCSDCAKEMWIKSNYPEDEGEDLDHPENPNSTYSNEIANQIRRR